MSEHRFSLITLVFALVLSYAQCFGAAGDDRKGAEDGKKTQDAKEERGPLAEVSRLTLIQKMNKEFAKARKKLPGGKNGVYVAVHFDNESGKYVAALDEVQLNKELAKSGFSIIPDDDVEITDFVIKGKQIMIVLNGGLKKKWSWRDHISGGVSGPGSRPPVKTTTTVERQGEDKKKELANKPGSAIILDFGRDIPEITAEELKKLLEEVGVLDFSNQESAAVQKTEEWPEDVRKAVTEGRVIAGMTTEQVKKALKRNDYEPSKERNADGKMILTWKFGKPPMMFFIDFDDENIPNSPTYGKVVCVHEEPNFSECKQASRPRAIQPIEP